MAADPGTKFTAILRVVKALLEGRQLTRKQMAELAGVSVSQAGKYVAILKRDLGHIREGDGAVHLAKDQLFEKPSSEAVVGAALMTGIARLFEGTSYAKGMRETLDYVAKRAAQQKDHDDLRRKFVFLTKGGDPALSTKPKFLEALLQAILDCRCVELDYVTFDGKPVHERVEPIALVIHEHQLYVVVRDSAGRVAKPRRFSRIRHVELTSREFLYPEPSEFDPDTAFNQVWGIFLGVEAAVTDVVVRFSQTYRTYVENHRWHPSQTIVDKAKLHVRFTIRPCDEFEQWVLGLGENVEVLSPAPLRAKLAGRMREALKVYATDPEVVPARTGRKPRPAARSTSRRS